MYLFTDGCKSSVTMATKKHITMGQTLHFHSSFYMSVCNAKLSWIGGYMKVNKTI